jgi:hypothetical protein
MGGLLHDTLEDTDATYEDLEQRFGPEVAALVAEVTDDKSLPKEERKRLQITKTPGKSRRAKLLKLADKTSNLRGLMQSPPVGWTQARLRDYVVWAEEVVRSCRGLNPELEAAFDAAHAEVSRHFPETEETMFYDAAKRDHRLTQDPLKSLIARPIGWISTQSSGGPA